MLFETEKDVVVVSSYEKNVENGTDVEAGRRRLVPLLFAPQFFSGYSFCVHHRDDREILAHAMASDYICYLKVGQVSDELHGEFELLAAGRASQQGLGVLRRKLAQSGHGF
jgi:hypothetical protein